MSSYTTFKWFRRLSSASLVKRFWDWPSRLCLLPKPKLVLNLTSNEASVATAKVRWSPWIRKPYVASSLYSAIYAGAGAAHTLFAQSATSSLQLPLLSSES